jgi:hypothetical protein
MMFNVLFVAVAGLVLGLLHYIVDVPLPLISYLQILGGFLVVVAGFLVPVLNYLNGRKLKEQRWYQCLVATVLVVLGGMLFYRGVDRTELKQAQQAIQLNNAEQLMRAMNAYNTQYPASRLSEQEDETPVP